MYLICRIDVEQLLRVVHRCTTAQEVTDFMDIHRGNGIEYFVLVPFAFPEKR